MGLFNPGKYTKNSGASGGGFTLTSASAGKQKVKAIRMEWTAPCKAGAGSRRPGK